MLQAVPVSKSRAFQKTNQYFLESVSKKFGWNLFFIVAPYALQCTLEIKSISLKLQVNLQPNYIKDISVLKSKERSKIISIRKSWTLLWCRSDLQVTLQKTYTGPAYNEQKYITDNFNIAVNNLEPENLLVVTGCSAQYIFTPVYTTSHLPSNMRHHLYDCNWRHSRFLVRLCDWHLWCHLSLQGVHYMSRRRVII